MVRQRTKQAVNFFIFIILLSLSSCTSCGCPGYIDYYRTDQEFVTSHGITVYPQGNMVAPEEIEQATETFIWDVVLSFPCIYTEQEVRDAIDGVIIYVEEDNFRCVIRQNGVLTVTWCSGLYNPSADEIKYVNKCCIGDAALIHELIHLVNLRIEEITDYDHEREKFFGNKEGSLEYDTNQHIKDEFCRCRCW